MPIDITKKNIRGKCELKCSYKFNYSNSNSNAYNKGDHLMLSYENDKKSYVFFNKAKYNVLNISLYTPSIHLYDNDVASAEMIITHQPVLGGKRLLVSIPILLSTSSFNAASTLLKEVIDKSAREAPEKGDTTNLNISNFNLNHFVPVKPFYTYESTEKEDVIVFDKLYGIPLNEDSIRSLVSIINIHTKLRTGGQIYHNELGPQINDNRDGIYISCKPTGSSKDNIEVLYPKKSSHFLSNIMSGNFNSTSTTELYGIDVNSLIVLFYFTVAILLLSFVANFVFQGSSNKIIKNVSVLSISKST